jgi:RimJ/RimL family protein N-acetyltransferase
MSKPDLPTLTGEHVTLRPPRPEDAEARYRLGSDPEIARMYGASRCDVRPMTLDGAARWVQGLMSRDHVWVIETDRLIGHIRLDRVDLNDRRASLAIGIEDPAQLGRGLGSEAIRLVQGYAFQTLALHRLSIRVVAYNLRAIRAYEKCGFVIEGREREAAFVDGAWHDDVMMGMLDREYASLLVSDDQRGNPT